MAGEKGHVDAESIFSGDIRNGDEILKCLLRDAVGVRLEVIPQQEYSHDIEPDLLEDCKLFAYFTSVKVTPPIHSFATRPVINAEGEICHGFSKFLGLGSFATKSGNDVHELFP